MKGWWAISADELFDMLRRCSDGEDADGVYAEHYANAEGATCNVVIAVRDGRSIPCGLWRPCPEHEANRIPRSPTAESIVRKIAKRIPPLACPNEYECAFCGESFRVLRDTRDVARHTETCIWRLCNEWVGRNGAVEEGDE